MVKNTGYLFQIKNRKDDKAMEDLCVCCGNYVPEGRQVCPMCEDSIRNQRIILLRKDEPMEFIKTDDKVQIHLKTCTMLNDLYERKNNDYGDSFGKLRKEIPGAILVRIYDKYSRLKTLLEGTDQLVKDESIDDTLVDLANYCIMELVERKVANGN